MATSYAVLSAERKKMQEEDKLPQHWSTASWQMFKEKYLYKADHPREQYQRIATTLAMHTPNPEEWKEKFFDVMWKGWLSPSTPILSNTGTSRGLPVSCAGTYFPDSIDGIYKSKHEIAILTKQGFGTSGYFGDIRPRGTPISTGGKSSGVMPVIEGIVKDMEYVAQGTTRRGSCATYLPISHGDFGEVCDYLSAHPDGLNIGWNWYDTDTTNIKAGDEETNSRFSRMLKTKMVTGKGYMFFPDKANRRRPQMYVDKGLDIKASQLCNEIVLHSDINHTYTCVLASMNLAKWEEWKDTDAVFVSTVFLDCVAQEFINRAKNISGLERAVAFTKKSRALGLGVCGLVSLYQDKMLPFESFEAMYLNNEIFRKLQKDSLEGSQWIASVWGEPEWCKGYGVANTHRLACAPTKSTALIMGGCSEGINPDTAMVFTQRTSAGEIDRVNPYLLKLMKSKGVYTKERIREVREAMGSVQDVEWLTEEEKEVFKTAFEINQYSILQQAEQRGRLLCQWQSLNLFLSADEDEAKIAAIHQYAVESEDILGLYYVYSKAGVQASSGECTACM